MKDDFDKWVDEWVEKLNVVKMFLIIILAIVLLVVIFTRLNEYKDRIDSLENKVITLDEDNKELWKNIDAMSEDYTTLWVQIFGEDSWYASPKDKEKVQNELNKVGE